MTETRVAPQANDAVLRRRFPIIRSLVALVVVPIATVVVPMFVGEFFQRKPPWEHDSWLDVLWYGFLFTASAAWYYAIPGFIVFLVLGIPTLYLLYRSNRLGFGWFMLFGALYTALPFPFLGLFVYQSRSEYLGYVRALMYLYAPIGIFGGILTRLIVFGRR